MTSLRPVLALIGLLFVAVVGLACSTGSQASTPTATVAPLAADRIELETTSSTQYYDVQGTTSDAMFDYIGKNGPQDGTGQRGSGLTAAKWSYSWQAKASSGTCGIGSMNISLSIVVTLPRHAQESALSDVLRTNWKKYVASVTTHEQHHVDIYMDGAKTTQQSMAAIPAMSTCEALEKEIGSVWSSQQQTIEAKQQKFHADEDARLTAQRAPLQNQIDVNRRQLASLSDQIDDADASIAKMRDQISAMEAQLTPLKAQLDAVEKQYPTAVPPEVFSLYEGLRQQYNTLIQQYNTLVQQHNEALSQRSKLAGSHDSLVSTTNALVDSYNWLR